MDKIVNVYKTLSLVPALVDAQITSNGRIVRNVWSHRNVEKLKIVKFVRNIFLTSDFVSDCELGAVDCSTEVLSSFSPSEKYRAVIRDNEGKQYLEVWTKECLLRTVDLSALDIHGKIYTTAEFKSLEWKPDETKILYVAEEKPTPSEPFYARKSKKDDSEKKPGQEYVYKQDWGEQMVGEQKSVIAEYDVTTDSVELIKGVPSDLCPGQLKYSPCGQFIVGVAYTTTPRKLGLIYCTNRSSVIFKLQDENYEVLSDLDKVARNPLFVPNGDALIYLSRNAGGPHMSTMELIQTSLNAPKQTHVVVKIVDEAEKIANDATFHGLYNSTFIKRCWASGNRLIVSTNQKYTISSYVIDLDNRTITKLPANSADDESLIVLDIWNDVIVANRRNFLRQDVLLIGKLPSKGQEKNISWTELTDKKDFELLGKSKFEYLDLQQDKSDDVTTFSAIYVGPSSGNEKTVPLIVYPHGGPHSAFANNFSLDVSFSLANGYAVLLINYRGSIGAGEKSVKFLTGRIGEADVSDCILAVTTALKRFPFLDESKVALCGGSHGGFLVTHLAGQYPEMFKAVVSRNPVIDVASMSIFSDIPDWCYVESSGREYTQKGPIDDNLLLEMRKKSPIKYAHKVKAPIMLQVGSNDLRVPPGQSYEYYHRLKANDIPVEMHLYDDNHPLGQVKNEMDNLINTILWINKHLNI